MSRCMEMMSFTLYDEAKVLTASGICKICKYYWEINRKYIFEVSGRYLGGMDKTFHNAGNITELPFV